RAGPHNPRPAMLRWLDLLLDTVFPKDCEACARALPPGHDGFVCGACWSAMRPPPEPLCPSCGAPLGAVEVPAACSACVRHQPAFTTARAAALYLPGGRGLNPLAVTVQALKYRWRRNLADT